MKERDDLKREDNTYPKKPDYIAYNVQESRDGKGHWSRVGAAFEHRDGKGYDIALDSVPVDGRVTLREMRDQRQQSHDNQRHEPENSQTMSQNHDRER